MKRIIVGCVLVIAMSLLLISGPAVVHTQTVGNGYQTMSSREWSAWNQAFNALTAKQRAEVIRRHVDSCLQLFAMTESQRSLVKDITAKFVVEGMYSATDPARRAALQNEMKSEMDHAKAVLGEELFVRVFGDRPPMTVINAVKGDPRFK